jgi:hypothetical protein
MQRFVFLIVGGFIPNTSVKNNTPNVIIPGGSVMTGSKIQSAHLNVDYIH